VPSVSSFSVGDDVVEGFRAVELGPRVLRSEASGWLIAPGGASGLVPSGSGSVDGTRCVAGALWGDNLETPSQGPGRQLPPRTSLTDTVPGGRFAHRVLDWNAGPDGTIVCQVAG